MLYKCMCKGTNRESSEPRYSQNWFAARRATFKVFTDRIECGDWRIPFAEITGIHLYRSRQMFIPVKILHVTTSSRNYQFGFNPWAHPEKHLQVEYEESTVRLKYSLYSILVRVAALSLLVYWVWRRWIGG